MGAKIKDNGFINYKRNIKLINSKVVKVGLFASVGDEVLTKGIVNEFGTTTAGRNRNITIPSRSFIRSTYNKQYKNVSRRFGQVFKSISKDSGSLMSKLRLIGLEQEREIKKTMTDLRSPKNAPSTIKKKGSSNPLIDTGELRSKITSEVKNKYE